MPFDGPDAVSVAMQQVKDEPAAPSSINPSIDPDLETSSWWPFRRIRRVASPRLTTCASR